MYDITYLCRYHKDDVFIETDNITDVEKDIVRDILYKEDLLNIFNINENDELNFSIISELYNLLSKSNELVDCMKIAASKIFSDDEASGLCILYSFDYMFLTHKCVCEYLKNGVISKKEINSLKNIL